MRYLSLIFTLPFAVAAIAFALTNRGDVTVNALGLGLEIVMPVYFLAFAFFLGGFFIGGIASWFGRRKKIKALKAEIKNQQSEIDRLKTKNAKLEAKLEDYGDVIDAPIEATDSHSLKLVNKGN